MTTTELDTFYALSVLYRRALQLLAEFGYDECADLAASLDALAAVAWEAGRC